MYYKQDILVSDSTGQVPSLFAVYDPVFLIHPMQVLKSPFGIFKGHSMAGEIALCLGNIPFETHRQSCQSVYWLSTQVSLLPPPWLELTTSEPRLRATRVRPPGTMVTLSP